MKDKCIVLNAKKMNFDGQLDFSTLSSDVTIYDDTTEEELLGRIKDADMIVTKEMPVTKETILQFPDSVKLICEAGTGYNNIDLEACNKKGITVCNIPAYSTERVAHTAIMLLLNLSSSMQVQMKMLANNNYDNFTHNLQVPNVEVNDKTLGIIGAGLDVQEQEPPQVDSPLYTLDNVILTPHMGWKGLETRQRLVSILKDNIQHYLDGHPINVVSNN